MGCLLLSGGSASRRSRDASPGVSPSPHQSTACRTDRPSSSVIVRSASPALRSASRTAASRSPSAASTSTANPSSRRGSRRVLCAALPGHPVPPAVLPASQTADSSHLLVDTGPSFSRKRLRTSRAVITDDLDLLHVPPSRFQNPMCHTPLSFRVRSRGG